jgi:hypothetical protein
MLINTRFCYFKCPILRMGSNLNNIIRKIKKYFLLYKVKEEGGYAFSPSIRKFYINNYGIHIGYGSYGGISIIIIYLPVYMSVIIVQLRRE